jgi:hypothetical protein
MQERRREPRVSLALPIKVVGYRADHTQWSEITHAEDLSSGGAAFRLRRPVSLGEVLQLSLPMPKALRQYDLMDASYLVYGIVRDIGPPDASGARVGVMLQGKRPPAGFDKGVRVLLPSDQIRPRQHPRYELKLNVKLRRLDTTVGPLEEWTVTENLGPGGASVPTGLPIMKGDSVCLETADGAFRARASVQSLTIGKDNVPRLSLAFLDTGADEAIAELLRRHGFLAPAPRPAAAPSPLASAPLAPVRFDRREPFPDCASGQHELCLGWDRETEVRVHRLCRCSCHDG